MILTQNILRWLKVYNFDFSNALLHDHKKAVRPMHRQSFCAIEMYVKLFSLMLKDRYHTDISNEISKLRESGNISQVNRNTCVFVMLEQKQNKQKRTSFPPFLCLRNSAGQCTYALTNLHLKSKAVCQSNNFKDNKDQRDVVIVTKSKTLSQFWMKLRMTVMSA